MRIFICATSLLAAPLLAQADTTVIDLGALPSKQVHEVATLTPLAITDGGKPSVALLDLADGEIVPPHATQQGIRLLTVLKGELFWGDGDEIDPAKEITYPAGSVLTVSAGDSHWLAARAGDLRLQMVLLHAEKPTPDVQAQMR